MQKEKYNEMKQILEQIPDDKLIVIAGHERPDMDSIGSSLALTRFLNKIKKNAIMLLEEKELYQLNWFNDYRYVETEVKNKNNYVFILMDAPNKSRLGIFEKYFDEADITINIDHHEKNKHEADYLLAISEMSSTSEILFNLFSMFNEEIDLKIAELLYAGIVTDTSGFAQRVTSRNI